MFHVDILCHLSLWISYQYDWVHIMPQFGRVIHWYRIIVFTEKVCQGNYGEYLQLTLTSLSFNWNHKKLTLSIGFISWINFPISKTNIIMVLTILTRSTLLLYGVQSLFALGHWIATGCVGKRQGLIHVQCIFTISRDPWISHSVSV